MPSQHRNIVWLALGALSLAPALLSITPASAQDPRVAPKSEVVPGARDVVTEESLKKTIATGKKISTMKDAFLPMTEVRPDLTPSLYKRSIVLFDGSAHTVVPQGAMLRLPPGYRNRVIDGPKGEFIFWPAFLEKNSKWLGAWEVPLAMAKGDQTLAQKVLKQVAQDARVLVAVYKSCPITILEPVEEKAVGATPSAAASKTGEVAR